MRKESESTRFIVKDLTDQPQAGSVLLVGSPVGIVLFQVDAYTTKGEAVSGFRRVWDHQSGEQGLLPVVSFHKDFRWMIINNDHLELTTAGQLREVAKTDFVEELEKTQKTMQELFEAVQEGREADLPPTKTNQPSPDSEAWLERELRRMENFGDKGPQGGDQV